MRRRPRTRRGRLQTRRLPACLVLLVAVAAVPGAAAHQRSEPAKGGAEQRLSAEETALLGEAHAMEHARLRELNGAARRRWLRLTPRQRRRIAARERSEQHALERAAGPPERVGAWTTAPFRLPVFGMHAAVLPTGKVLIFSGPSKSSDPTPPLRGDAALWDPALGTGNDAFRAVQPPPDEDGETAGLPAAIFCSGHAFLPNGSLVVAGGSLVWPAVEGDAFTDFAGLRHVFSFDPWGETWQTQPSMGHGRWYPSLLEMADGRILILGGFNEEPPGAVRNLELEVFAGTPSRSGVGRISRHATGDRSVAPYPQLFTLPNQDVLLAGPEAADSAVLDPATFTWRDIPNASRDRIGGNAVQLVDGPGGSRTFALIGGYDPDEVDADGLKPATETSEVLRHGEFGQGWNGGPSMNLERSYQNTVLLPDGSMVAVGGGIGYGPTAGAFDVDPAGTLRQVELYDPTTRSWRLGPPQREDRAYHSTAVLLPSGRILSSGDDYNPTEEGKRSSFDTAEIYSPPYLFHGRRPRIRFAPRSIHWGDAFRVRSRGRVSRAVLMAPSATTHAVDMNQRYVPLRVLRRFGRRGAKLRAPVGAGVAPPGYYMLFLLNRKGVPSRARWIRVSANAPDRAPPSPGR